MKTLLLSLLLIGSAHAGTLLQLPLPPSLATVGQSGTKSCAGNRFNVDGSVVGACRTVMASACSGRGCQPVSYVTAYVVTWDTQGTSTGVIACSVTRHHLPQANIVTYAPGYDASTCPPVNLSATGTAFVINGTPYYYVTTDAASGAVLVNSNSWGFLYLP